MREVRMKVEPLDDTALSLWIATAEYQSMDHPAKCWVSMMHYGMASWRRIKSALWALLCDGKDSWSKLIFSVNVDEVGY